MMRYRAVPSFQEYHSNLTKLGKQLARMVHIRSDLQLQHFLFDLLETNVLRYADHWKFDLF